MSLTGQLENIGGISRPRRQTHDGDDAQKEIRWLMGLPRLGIGAENGVPPHCIGLHTGEEVHCDEIHVGMPHLPLLQGG